MSKKPVGGVIAAGAPAGATAAGLLLTGGSEKSPDAAAHQGMVEGTVWVANEYGNSITAIDASTNQAVATLTGIEGPHNIQAAPDGRSVWAVSGHGALAAMIDAATCQVHGTGHTGGG